MFYECNLSTSGGVKYRSHEDEQLRVYPVDSEESLMAGATQRNRRKRKGINSDIDPDSISVRIDENYSSVRSLLVLQSPSNQLKQ